MGKSVAQLKKERRDLDRKIRSAERAERSAAVGSFTSEIFEIYHVKTVAEIHQLSDVLTSEIVTRFVASQFPEILPLNEGESSDISAPSEEYEEGVWR